MPRTRNISKWCEKKTTNNANTEITDILELSDKVFQTAMIKILL